MIFYRLSLKYPYLIIKYQPSIKGKNIYRCVHILLTYLINSLQLFIAFNDIIHALFRVQIIVFVKYFEGQALNNLIMILILLNSHIKIAM